MKQRLCILCLLIVTILTIVIPLAVYFKYHSKKQEVVPISILDTTIIAVITISNSDDDNNNHQLTNGFTSEHSLTNQLNNPATSTSYLVKDSTSSISTYTLASVSTKAVQNTVQSTFQTTNIDITGQKITTSGNAQTSLFMTSTMKSNLYTTLASSTKQELRVTDITQLTMTNKQDGITSKTILK
ncbi:unnamed protein product [Adineta steineri]|uniref:Uncharacterized protein n=1 Tax=Adineta steineri TaxID=433720 RepID=A0A820DNA4_9BILA|nr:unnamed protein product [Adineta steineri]